MNEETMSKALDAIHDEAAKLLKFEMAPEVRTGLGLIVSLARYKFDVRGSHEGTDRSNDGE